MRLISQVAISIAGGALAGAFVVMIAAPRGGPGVIHCQRIEIVDREGNRRVVLGVDNTEAAGIQFMNKAGKESIRLSVSGDGRFSNLVFRDGDQVLLSTSAKADWGSTITLGGPGQRRLTVGAMPNDIEGHEESADWGLQVRGAVSTVPVISINVHTDSTVGKSVGGIVITNPNGKWSETP